MLRGFWLVEKGRRGLGWCGGVGWGGVGLRLDVGDILN